MQSRKNFREKRRTSRNSFGGTVERPKFPLIPQRKTCLNFRYLQSRHRCQTRLNLPKIATRARMKMKMKTKTKTKTKTKAALQGAPWSEMRLMKIFLSQISFRKAQPCSRCLLDRRKMLSSNWILVNTKSFGIPKDAKLVVCLSLARSSKFLIYCHSFFRSTHRENREAEIGFGGPILQGEPLLPPVLRESVAYYRIQHQWSQERMARHRPLRRHTSNVVFYPSQAVRCYILDL